MDDKGAMSTILPRRRLLGILGAFLLTVSADGVAAERGEHDHDRARRALERGEILSLDRVLTTLRQRLAGEILEVELEREHGTWVYEFKVLRPDGRVVELYVDAATARVVKEEDD